MNSEHITIKATVAVWGRKEAYDMRELSDALEKGDALRAINRMFFYGDVNRETFSDYVRMGEADVTMRLLPRDEQTRMAVKALQTQLDEERVKWHQRQEAILAEISKLQAIEYTVEA